MKTGIQVSTDRTRSTYEAIIYVLDREEHMSPQRETLDTGTENGAKRYFKERKGRS